MKRSRIKVIEGEAFYHCMSRAVKEMPFWDEQTREAMRKQLWRVAEFSGVQVLTYCLMSNHFHVLIRVPDRKGLAVADEELLRRYRLLYPRPTRFERLRIEVLAQILKENGSRAEALRKRLLARMHDVSEFMKTFKQRFTAWFNRTHGRFGTLWAERFKSVLVEGTRMAAQTVAAYIDLNPVRAGLVSDPKDYRWCGYAEAVAGRREARQGIIAVTGQQPALVPPDARNTAQKSAEALAQYRVLLFGKGLASPYHKAQAASLPPEEARKVLEAGGKLPAHALLRCRVRYLTDGLILGSAAFVQRHLEERLRRGEIRRRPMPSALPSSGLDSLTVGKRFKRPRPVIS